jgi:hypothetical protein
MLALGKKLGFRIEKHGGEEYELYMRFGSAA